MKNHSDCEYADPDADFGFKTVLKGIVVFVIGTVFILGLTIGLYWWGYHQGTKTEAVEAYLDWHQDKINYEGKEISGKSDTLSCHQTAYTVLPNNSIMIKEDCS